MQNKFLRLVRVGLACVAAAAVPLVAANTAGAHGYEQGGLKIKHPWTRATPPGAKVAGGFVSVTNNGKQADRLTGGSFELSNSVEVHEMTMTDGVMRMHEVEGGIEIAPGATVELKPGGYHLMFMDLSGEPKEGTTVKGTLKFQNAGEVAVEFAVAPIGAKSHSDNQGGSAAGSGHEGNGGHEMKHNH